MRDKDREPSEVMVMVPDFSKILKEMFEKKDFPEDVVELYIPRNIGYVLTEDGRAFVIDSEGVGEDIDLQAEDAIAIDIYYKKEKSFSVVPNLRCNVSLKAIMELPHKEVPLHKFIREFGSRLEENYIYWKNILEGVVA